MSKSIKPTSIKPAKYWRLAQKWSEYLGARGRVLAATTIRVASPTHQALAPYGYILLELTTGERLEVMSTRDQSLEPEDEVELVLRRTRADDAKGVINYQLKAKRIKDQKRGVKS